MRRVDAKRRIEVLAGVIEPSRIERLDAVARNRLRGVAVLLEDLEDPHNGGACLRSIEAMGLLEAHLVEPRDRFRFSDRVTQGCEKWLEISRHRSMTSAATQLKARGYKLYAALPSATTRLDSLDPLVPAVFMMGNEIRGLSQEARAHADVEFCIPMSGFSESVNLSVATALCVYTHAEARRRALGRTGDLDEEAVDALRARYYELSVRGAEAILARYGV